MESAAKRQARPFPAPPIPVEPIQVERKEAKKVLKSEKKISYDWEMSEPEEVTKFRNKEKTAHKKAALKPIDIDDNSSNNKEFDVEEFDLRQAVIHATLLERPYK